MGIYTYKCNYYIYIYTINIIYINIYETTTYWLALGLQTAIPHDNTQITVP